MRSACRDRRTQARPRRATALARRPAALERKHADNARVLAPGSVVSGREAALLRGALGGAVSDALITMYTTTWCGDCRAAKLALEQAGVPFREVDVEHDEAALAHLLELNAGRRSVPTLVFGETSASLSGFSPAKLEAFLRAIGRR